MQAGRDWWERSRFCGCKVSWRLQQVVVELPCNAMQTLDGNKSKNTHLLERELK